MKGDDEGENKRECIKIALIGNSGVGKTCISQRYTKDEFYTKVDCTVGASYFQKFIEIDGKEYQLDIWDTAGQEKYRSMGKMFYKNAYIILFVYDITSIMTFQELKEVWYKELKNSGEKHTVMAVVGNKNDLYVEEQVKEDEARKWANEIGAIFGLVSAKTGDGIKELFENAVRKYLSPEFEAEIKEEKKSKGEAKKINKNIKTNEKNKKSGCNCSK